MLLLWAAFRRLSLQRILAARVVASMGALAAWFPVASYFWRHIAFGELVYAAWTFSIYYGSASQTTILSAALDAFSRLQILASLVVCAIVGLMLYVRLATSGHSPGPEDKWRASARLLVASGPPVGRLRPGRSPCRGKELPARFLAIGCKPVGRGGNHVLVSYGGYSEAGRLVGCRQGPLCPYRRPPHLRSGVRCPADAQLGTRVQRAARSQVPGGRCHLFEYDPQLFRHAFYLGLSSTPHLLRNRDEKPDASTGRKLFFGRRTGCQWQARPETDIGSHRAAPRASKSGRRLVFSWRGGRVTWWPLRPCTGLTGKGSRGMAP
jgi:hypothetical protein